MFRPRVSNYIKTHPEQIFSEIKEAPEYSGITDIASDMDASGPLYVFDLYGRQVGQDIDGLAPGIYIIRQGNNSKKDCGEITAVGFS